MKTCAKCRVTKDNKHFYRAAKASDGLQSYCKLCIRAASDTWLANNPEARARRSRSSGAYDKRRRALDPHFRLRKLLRERMNKALANKQKVGSAVRLLGCSVQEFSVYLESKFAPGMTWENKGLWHIDHIVPVSAFDLTKLPELEKACHYTNLQPLWAADNLRKSNKAAA